MVRHSGPEVACAVLMPHAPILVPGVGGSRQNEAAATVHAMGMVSRRVVQHRPDALVLISPHSPRRRSAFGIWTDPRISGSLEQFEAPEAAVDLPNDVLLAGAIEREAEARSLTVWHIQNQALDHGTVVPLWHLVEAGWTGPTVVLSLNYPGDGGLVEFGTAIAAAARRAGRRIALVASGDMSHRLIPGAPGGFDRRAQAFDHEFIRLLRGGSYEDVPRVDPGLQEVAGEDVVDSTVIALAAVDWNPAGHEVLSYEGPFGVGYGVAVLFDPDTADREPTVLPPEPGAEQGVGEELPRIARQSVAAAFGLEDGSAPRPREGFLAQPGAVFVTVRDLEGSLRGCIGTLSPRYPSRAEETWHLARAAVFDDARFSPLTPEELPRVRFGVSVLHPLEAVDGPAQLDPQRFGVVVSAPDGRRGTLLPGVGGVASVEEQLRIARRKGRIAPQEPVQLERFTVDEYLEVGFVEKEE